MLVTGSILDSLEQGRALFLRWPPANGRFSWGFCHADAADTLERGWIVVDGQRATVASFDEDDPRMIDFVLDEFELRDGSSFLEPVAAPVLVAA